MNEFTIVREFGPEAAPPSDDVLAKARAELMTELRARPPRRFPLRVAAAVAAAAVIGLVVAFAQLGGGPAPEQAAPAPIRLVDFQTPELPPELAPVPSGLHQGGLTGEPGWLGRGYAPATPGSLDHVTVKLSWRGHDPYGTGPEFRETTYDGKRAYVGTDEAINGADPSEILRTVYLAWQTGPDTWTILSGSGRFATEENVRALADTLVPATDTLDLSIDVAPAGWELYAFKNGVTTLRDPAAQDHELTVSLQDGLTADFAENTQVPADRVVPVTVNGGEGELLALTDGTWMLQALLPDGRAFLLQASAGFTEAQVIEVAQGVHT